MRKLIPGIRKIKGSYKIWRERLEAMEDVTGAIYVFPPLAECWAALEQHMQHKITWLEKEDWTTESPPEPMPRDDEEM